MFVKQCIARLSRELYLVDSLEAGYRINISVQFNTSTMREISIIKAKASSRYRSLRLLKGISTRDSLQDLLDGYREAIRYRLIDIEQGIFIT